MGSIAPNVDSDAGADQDVDGCSNTAEEAHEAYVLPRGINATFLAEGAANVLYRISTQASNVHQDHTDKISSISLPEMEPWPCNFPKGTWDFKLLRLRKNLDYIATTADTYANFIAHIKPLFNHEDLLRHDLVDLRECEIINQLNEDLKTWEAESYQATSVSLPRQRRDDRRKGIYLAPERYGLLVNDMSPVAGTRLLEFKPKWLHQSPAAPKGSKRCRTCAKRARENALKSNLVVSAAFCPLDLTSTDHEILIRPAKAILNLENPQQPEEIKRLHDFCEWARGSVIHRLAAIQAELDPKGVFAADPQDKKFLTAMSLRDCSLFLLIPDHPNPADPHGNYEARLGDLDVKLPVKANYWRSVEQALSEEGWYMGTEAQELKQPLDCGLYPEYWTPASKRHLLVAPK